MSYYDQDRQKKRRITREGDYVDTSKPTAFFQPSGGREWTVSVAVPGSVLSTCRRDDQRTGVVSHIARALAVFSIDEIVVFDDSPMDSRPTNVDPSGYTGDVDPCGYLDHLLQYMEMPPFMRRTLLPLHPNLKAAGLMASLDIPSHPHHTDWLPYCEGVTTSGAPANGSGTLVDVGRKNPVTISQDVPPKTRITLQIDDNDWSVGEPVDPATPRTEGGYYWGYSVRRCNSLAAVFEECTYEGGYDMSVGTSERGLSIPDAFPEKKKKGPGQLQPPSDRLWRTARPRLRQSYAISNIMSNNASGDQINVGAGLGGCACALALKHHGHSVIVYERLRIFRRLGDSLGLGENALKLLERWGGRDLYHRLTSIGNQAPDMQIRRWHDGKILAVQPLMDMAGYIGHRGDYHTAFLDAVRDAGIEIRMGCEVADYEDEPGRQPAIVLADGTRVAADVIVGADGIKSRARELVLGFADAPKSSGYSCYRAYFPGSHLKEDPLFRNGDEFNWIVTRKLSHEADMEIRESWYQEGDLEDVARVTATVDPRIRAAVAKTPSCLDWKICYRDPLPTWVSPRSHSIALLGDSCHPHLPTSAQGASQATESGAVLATRTYEKLRFARTRASQSNGEDLRDRWHNALKDVDDGVEIDPESLKIRNRWLYAFDAEADTLERWEEVSSLVSSELQTVFYVVDAHTGETVHEKPRLLVKLDLCRLC
ncbi:hypothetical protein EKO27_g9935 [Xylaria grammica]|uniref:FAD-binding domain-containing protein n=1 Tax=Xylaria grammica TaxID=363999 RepID=A0A439CSW5_9PEZI|nr:hypothetical protein EKO27_g9935 [Xylaria grammica]